MIKDAWWSTDRTERYRVVLLNQDESTRDSELDGVLGGTIDTNADSEIRSAGNLDLVITNDSKNVDWATVRLRVEYILTWQGSQKVYPLGVFIPSAPKTNMSATGSKIDMEIYDKTIILKQDCLRKSLSFAKGTLMTDAVRSVITSTGEDNVSITASAKRLTSHRVYPAGTSKLEIVQKLLLDLNYFAIWCDGNGQYQCHPYLGPAMRAGEPDGLVYAFNQGDKAIHSADWVLDQDGFDVPNRVVCIGRTSGKAKAKIGVAEDHSSRWSYESRGRWITRVETDVDEKTQAKVSAKAALLLSTSQAVHDHLTINHAWLPLQVNDIVTFKSQGYSGAFALRKSTVTLEPTVLVESYFEGVTI